MPIQIKQAPAGNIVEVHVSGKLTTEEYQRFAPEFDRSIAERGKIRLLFEMSQFDGWEAGAAWQDVKLSLRHFTDIGRVAMVGEKKWQQFMTHILSPFTRAEVRYFDHGDLAAARKWLEGD